MLQNASISQEPINAVARSDTTTAAGHRDGGVRGQIQGETPPLPGPRPVHLPGPQPRCHSLLPRHTNTTIRFHPVAAEICPEAMLWEKGNKEYRLA